jgi:hypothetical protein
MKWCYWHTHTHSVWKCQVRPCYWPGTAVNSHMASPVPNLYRMSASRRHGSARERQILTELQLIIAIPTESGYEVSVLLKGKRSSILAFTRCPSDARVIYKSMWPRHSWSGKSLVSHRGRPGSPPGLVKWDLWWTKWRRGRFSPSTSVSSAKTVHSTNFFIITITRGN